MERGGAFREFRASREEKNGEDDVWRRRRYNWTDKISEQIQRPALIKKPSLNERTSPAFVISNGRKLKEIGGNIFERDSERDVKILPPLFSSKFSYNVSLLVALFFPINRSRLDIWAEESRFRFFLLPLLPPFSPTRRKNHPRRRSDSA